MKRLLKVAVLSLFAGILVVGPVFATDGLCGGKYPNLSDSAPATGAATPAGFTVKCVTYTINGASTTIYAKSMGDCAQAGIYASNPQDCSEDKSLNTLVQTIITTIIFAVGMIAVVMIILGGISYATSQGDPSKVKKAKDTILYGIIGLVVALLAYAIVNFVLSSMA